MKQISWIGPSILALLALGGVFMQQRRVTHLERRLSALHESAQAGGSTDEVTALTARLERLERLVAWRAAAPQPSSAPTASATAPNPQAPAGSAAELQQIREDVDALLTGEAASTEQGKARLRALIAETQQQQWTERQQRRDERILQRLTETARLSARQREDLSKALEEERNQRRTLIANARAGQGNMEELRPALQALRAQTEQKARQFLDAEQLAQFSASRAPGRGPRGGGAEGDRTR